MNRAARVVAAITAACAVGYVVAALRGEAAEYNEVFPWLWFSAELSREWLAPFNAFLVVIATGGAAGAALVSSGARRQLLLLLLVLVASIVRIVWLVTVVDEFPGGRLLPASLSSIVLSVLSALGLALGWLSEHRGSSEAMSPLGHGEPVT